MRDKKTYRESLGLDNPPKGTKLEIKHMAGIGFYLLWPKCPDLENIVDGWFKVKKNAKICSKEHGWIV